MYFRFDLLFNLIKVLPVEEDRPLHDKSLAGDRKRVDRKTEVFFLVEEDGPLHNRSLVCERKGWTTQQKSCCSRKGGPQDRILAVLGSQTTTRQKLCLWKKRDGLQDNSFAGRMDRVGHTVGYRTIILLVQDRPPCKIDFSPRWIGRGAGRKWTGKLVGNINRTLATAGDNYCFRLVSSTRASLYSNFFHQYVCFLLSVSASLWSFHFVIHMPCLFLLKLSPQLSSYF